jgi:hypothetical protein
MRLPSVCLVASLVFARWTGRAVFACAVLPIKGLNLNQLTPLLESGFTRGPRLAQTGVDSFFRNEDLLE